jgi:nitroreductase
MDFFDLLVKRRSIRNYEAKEVPVETIKGMIRESCLAPSSGNGQPWKFIIVNNKGWIKKLSDESKKNLLASIEKNPDSPMKKYESALGNKDFNVFYNAPCLVYIGCSKEIRSADVDCALTACYFMLSAAAKDLGTCWVALGSVIQDPGIRREIGMPEDYQIIAPIIVGYPSSVPEKPMRNEPQILKIII